MDDTQVDLPVTAFVRGNGSPMQTRRSRPIARPQIAEAQRHWWSLPPDGRIGIELCRRRAIPAAAHGDEASGQTRGFSRIKPEKPNIVLGTPMEEPAFRLLRRDFLSTCMAGWWSGGQRHRSQGDGTGPRGTVDGETTGATDGVAQTDGSPDPGCRWPTSAERRLRRVNATHRAARVTA